MSLDEWLRLKGWPDRELAARISVSREYVRRLRKGEHNPSTEVMNRIRKETRGRVGRRDMAATYKEKSNGTLDHV